TNITGNVQSVEGGAGGTATANLMVNPASAVLPPTIGKVFGASSIALNGTTSLSLTLNNPNASTLTGLAFTDSLPSGLVVATPNGVSGSCLGNISAVAASASVSLANGALGPFGNCTITVNVTGTTAGLKHNVTGN